MPRNHRALVLSSKGGDVGVFDKVRNWLGSEPPEPADPRELFMAEVKTQLQELDHVVSWAEWYS